MTIIQSNDRSARGFMGSLTRRVLGWMLLVSLLPLLIMAYQGYHCAGQALVEQTQQHLDSLAKARARLIQEWLTARHNETALVARSLSDPLSNRNSAEVH